MHDIVFQVDRLLGRNWLEFAAMALFLSPIAG